MSRVVRTIGVLKEIDAIAVASAMNLNSTQGDLQCTSPTLTMAARRIGGCSEVGIS